MADDNTLSQIESAITRLQNGERIASIAYGDYAVKYERVELSELMALRDRLKAELRARNRSTKRRIVITTHKGVEECCG